MEGSKRSFRIGLCDFVQDAVAWVSLLAFGFLSLISLVMTCRIDIGYSEDNSEHVSFLTDNIPLNLIILLALIALAMLLMRAAVKRRTVAVVTAGVTLISAAIGVWWVLATKALPGADSKAVIDAAMRIAHGDLSPLSGSYFRVFPYQTGYLLFAEGFFRAFGTGSLLPLKLLNVAFVAAAQVASVLLAKALFDDPRVELLTALLSGLCLQNMLLSTFLYGTLPGLAFGIWSLYFVIRVLRGKPIWNLLIAAALIALAVTLKKNFLILLIAEVAMLLIYALGKKKPLVYAFVAVLVALSLLLPAVAQKQYEARADVALGKGTPQMAWLVTGFRESSLCCGWFNSYTTTVLIENDFDVDKTREQNKADLTERLTMFASRPRYLASFLFQKIVSQWNEPAYQCVWSSATAQAEGEPAAFVKDLQMGEAGDGLNAYFNQLMQFVYVALALALLALALYRSERSEARMLIPLVLLGAAAYHALFEAKSQYAIIYVPMMLPYAAYGVKRCAFAVGRLLSKRGKIKHRDE